MLNPTVVATQERSTAMKRINLTQFNKEAEIILQQKSKLIRIALNKLREIVSIKHLTLGITMQEELIIIE